MSEKCPVCGGDVDAFNDVAEAAFRQVAEFAERVMQERCVGGRIPDFLGEALLAGLMQGVVAVAFGMATANVASIRNFLEDELDFAIENEQREKEATANEGSMVQ